MIIKMTLMISMDHSLSASRWSIAGMPECVNVLEYLGYRLMSNRAAKVDDSLKDALRLALLDPDNVERIRMLNCSKPLHLITIGDNNAMGKALEYFRDNRDLVSRIYLLNAVSEDDL